MLSFTATALPIHANANVATKPAPSVTRFVVGQTYRCRSICDYDCIFSFTVLKRTDKFVTISVHGKTVSRKVRVCKYDNCEMIDPHGRYSMSPVLRATDTGGKIG